MIISYHNVCVYLYKTGEVHTACILEKEVMDQSREILSPPKELNDKAQIRIGEIQEKKNDGGFLVHLWEKEIGTVEVTEELKENNEILEQTQYMGDYYLHMGFYAIAIKHFCHVALSRYVRFGILDNRTLDSFIRLYVAAFANKEQQMMKEMLDYFDEELWQKNIQENLEESANGLLDKMECLKKIIEISKNVRISDEEIVRNMLAEVDK